MISNQALWQRLEAFQLDDPDAPFRFSDRLARENGWSAGFARRAVEEYKKFVYLAAETRTPVTPSDIVDQVWHLHLTFTRSYWDDMCANVLGKPLHHGPTKGGPAEDTRYRTQYAETLARYEAEFGAKAPETYWPHPDARFASAPHQRWIDRRTHFVIRKPRGLWSLITSGIAAIALAGTGAAIASESAATGPRANDWVFVGIVVGLIFFIAAAASTPKKKGKKGAGGCGGSCGSSVGKGDSDGGQGGDGGGDGGGGCGGGGCGS